MNPTSKLRRPPMSKELNGTSFCFEICEKCKGLCCKDANPPLTVKRQKIIQEYIEKNNLNIKKPFIKEKYSRPVTDQNGFCVFLDKKTMFCMIHPVKPETCRSGPVTFDINFLTGKLEFYLKKGAICEFAAVLYSNIYSNQSSFKEHFKVASLEITALVQGLPAEELKAILKIEEPDTFKFYEKDLEPEVVKKLGIKA